MIPTDDILAIIRDKISDSSLVQSITKDILAAEKELKQDRAEGVSPKAKTRFVIFLRSEDKAMYQAVKAGAVIASVPDDDSTATYSGRALLQRLQTAVIAHNEQPRKRKTKGTAKIITWQDAFTRLKSKTIKVSGSSIAIKNKGLPAEIVILETENVQPAQS